MKTLQGLINRMNSGEYGFQPDNWAPDYADSEGQTAPKGVFMANWNTVPTTLAEKTIEAFVSVPPAGLWHMCFLGSYWGAQKQGPYAWVSKLSQDEEARILRAQGFETWAPVIRENLKRNLPWRDNVNNVRDLYRAPNGLESLKKLFPFRDWQRFTDLLEDAGYGVEWSDEWSTCCDCGKAIRTNPDSYSWQPAYAVVNECELVCATCAQADPAPILEEYAREGMAISEDLGIDPTEYGWVRIDGEGRFGWDGWHDEKDLKAFKEGLEATGLLILIVQTDSRQFGSSLCFFVRPKEENEYGDYELTEAQQGAIEQAGSIFA